MKLRDTEWLVQVRKIDRAQRKKKKKEEKQRNRN